MSKDNNTNINNLMRECLQCGKEFIPDESGQECCDNACASAWYEWDDWDDDDDADYYDYDMKD